MRIVYINYVDCKNRTSGSSVRPLKMLEAFQELGHEVLFLVGEQFHPERVKSVNDFWNKIKNTEADCCYIESPTYPIVRHADRKLIKDISNKKIPVGYFYRDYYRKFPEQFPRKKGIVGIIKDLGLDVLQYLTDRVLHNCKIVYLPTLEASCLFNYNDMRALPPAGENHINKEKCFNHVGIYVGGVVEHYDSTLLLDSFEVLHEQDPSYKLILVCREEEWNQVKHSCKYADWIEVHHASGKALEPLYNQASIAYVMPDVKFLYNQMAVSVKTFEYVSYGLPVVAVKTQSMSEIFSANKIGLLVEATVQSVVKATKSILHDEATYRQYCHEVKDSLLEKNLWTHRASQVVKDLTGNSIK